MHNTTVTVTDDEALDVPGTGPSASLLEQIGGRPAVERLVNRFVHRTLSDRQLAPQFAGIDVVALRAIPVGVLLRSLRRHHPSRLERAAGPSISMVKRSVASCFTYTTCS